MNQIANPAKIIWIMGVAWMPTSTVGQGEVEESMGQVVIFLPFIKHQDLHVLYISCLVNIMIDEFKRETTHALNVYDLRGT